MMLVILFVEYVFQDHNPCVLGTNICLGSTLFRLLFNLTYLLSNCLKLLFQLLHESVYHPWAIIIKDTVTGSMIPTLVILSKSFLTLSLNSQRIRYSMGRTLRLKIQNLFTICFVN